MIMSSVADSAELRVSDLSFARPPPELKASR